MAHPNKAKHRKIYEHIRRAITNGEYQTGRRIPTEAQWATLFDTSRVTVSRALRELEQQGFLLRRRGAGTFVQQPQSSRAHLLGLISGATKPGFFAKVTDVVVRAAQRHHFGLLLAKWPEGDTSTIFKYVEDLREQYRMEKVRGVLLAPMDIRAQSMDFNARIAECFQQAGISVVLLDRDVVDHPQRSQFDLVGIDNFNAGFVLADYLLSLGHHRIGFVTHPRIASTVTARIAGYREALADQGIAPDEQWIHRGDCTDSAVVGRYLRASGVTAVVCVNDHHAAMLMRVLSTLGIAVPDDLAIVSIDDDQWATFLSVSLTTLRQPCGSLGSAAISLMLERLADPGLPPREARFTCKMIIRKSCGGAQASRGPSNASAMTETVA
jgi:GntR family transcriptional regulator, arabinose operon transcriptional repressor